MQLLLPIGSIAFIAAIPFLVFASGSNGGTVIAIIIIIITIIIIIIIIIVVVVFASGLLVGMPRAMKRE